MQRNTTQFHIRDPFKTSYGERAQTIEEFGVPIGVIVDHWGHIEAWVNYPHGPVTSHTGRIEAIKELRRRARETRPWLKETA